MRKQPIGIYDYKEWTEDDFLSELRSLRNTGLSRLYETRREAIDAAMRLNSCCADDNFSELHILPIINEMQRYDLKVRRDSNRSSFALLTGLDRNEQPPSDDLPKAKYRYGLFLNPGQKDPEVDSLNDAEKKARDLSLMNNGAPVAVWDEQDNTVCLFAGYEHFAPVR